MPVFEVQNLNSILIFCDSYFTMQNSLGHAKEKHYLFVEFVDPLQCLQSHCPWLCHRLYLKPVSCPTKLKNLFRNFPPLKLPGAAATFLGAFPEWELLNAKLPELDSGLLPPEKEAPPDTPSGPVPLLPIEKALPFPLVKVNPPEVPSALLIKNIAVSYKRLAAYYLENVV